jgi:hypothetical protein
VKENESERKPKAETKAKENAQGASCIKHRVTHLHRFILELRDFNEALTYIVF